MGSAVAITVLKFCRPPRVKPLKQFRVERSTDATHLKVGVNKSRFVNTRTKSQFLVTSTGPIVVTVSCLPDLE